MHSLQKTWLQLFRIVPSLTSISIKQMPHSGRLSASSVAKALFSFSSSARPSSAVSFFVAVLLFISFHTFRAMALLSSAIIVALQHACRRRRSFSKDDTVVFQRLAFVEKDGLHSAFHRTKQCIINQLVGIVGVPFNAAKLHVLLDERDIHVLFRAAEAQEAHRCPQPCEANLVTVFYGLSYSSREDGFIVQRLNT
mmetsp:Transcript_16943/g.25238  ORF Transcript_16943/g.25238 Transcript_16943/m.25238 type:complete len:196 (+) Transcript_16943:730-1317(+)